MCKLRMSSTLTRCLTRCMIELTPSRLTRVVKKTIARAYYKEINLTRLIRSPICVIILRQMLQTGPRSAVGNVFGYRCVSDCRSRGREFDPGPVPYFRGD